MQFGVISNTSSWYFYFCSRSFCDIWRHFSRIVTGIVTATAIGEWGNPEIYESRESPWKWGFHTQSCLVDLRIVTASERRNVPRMGEMRLVRFGIGYRFCEMKDVEKTKRASVHFMSNGRHGGCMSRLDNFT